MIANRAIAWLIGAGLLLLLLAGALAWPGWQQRAAQAAGLGARLTCSCRYVAGRTLDACRQDLTGIAWMRLVRYADDPQARRVSASVPLLASRAARLRPGYGCQMERR